MNKLDKALGKARDTHALVIGHGALEQLPGMFRQLFSDARAVVVADENTWAVAGAEAQRLLENAGIETAEPFIFRDPDLFAEWSFLMQLENHLKATGATAVAVGSGVINDLTKLASAHLGRRYIIAGTAASMDGYTAYGASVTFEGNKQTFDCPAPLGMVFDPQFAVKAPEGMSASGYADLIAKVPAGADWMLAEAAGVEKIDAFSFGLVQDDLKDTLSRPAAIAAGDEAATEKLAEGLIMSGFAMQALQSSRPASGTEHQFSHYWDMDNLCQNGRHVSHGFKVGIGTLVSTACLEFLLDSDVPGLDADKCAAAWPSLPELEAQIDEIFAGKPAHRERALTETRAKYADAATIKKQIVALQQAWPKLKPAIREQIYPFAEVKEKLKAIRAPYEPETIGISRERLKETFRGIPFMRSRFTGIDVLHRCGMLPAVTEKLFGKGGYWDVEGA